MNLVAIILLQIFVIYAVKLNCANILGLMGVPSPSHQIWNGVLFDALESRGHNLTILTVELPKNMKGKPSNVHYIHLEETYNANTHTYAHNYTHNDTHNEDVVEINQLIGSGAISGVSLFYEFGRLALKRILASNGIDILLNYPDNFKFDLILHDYTIGSYLLPFAHKFKNSPIIGVTAFHNPPNTVDLVGGHYFPGYIPFHSNAYDTYMSFTERMHNNMAFLLDTLYRKYVFMPKMNEMVRSKFGEDIPDLAVLEKQTVVALVNSHPAVNYVEPIPPNVIEVGGMQLVEPKKLPKDLQDFIESSERGAIFFSLGTNVKPTDLDERRTQIIIDTMTQLPQYNFLWKFDKDFIKSKLPRNILIRPFFPQRDILAHPKLKVFVTHAGGLSTQEATWHGVPMIGLALFVDQPRNLHKSLMDGVAESVDFLTLSVQSLKETILKVTENPKYRENMKIRSQRFRDRPMKPLDLAIWWVEYILRHPNPEHLRSPVNHIGFLAANSLDFIAFVFVVIALTFWIIRKIFKCISTFLCKSNKSDLNKKNK